MVALGGGVVDGAVVSGATAAVLFPVAFVAFAPACTPNRICSRIPHRISRGRA
jgi:hypothetical protein